MILMPSIPKDHNTLSIIHIDLCDIHSPSRRIINQQMNLYHWSPKSVHWISDNWTAHSLDLYHSDVLTVLLFVVVVVVTVIVVVVSLDTRTTAHQGCCVPSITLESLWSRCGVFVMAGFGQGLPYLQTCRRQNQPLCLRTGKPPFA